MMGAKVRTPFLAGQRRLKSCCSRERERSQALSCFSPSNKAHLVGLSRLVEVASRNGSSEKVVGRGSSVDVTGQVKVELVHGDDLRVSSSGGSSLDAERRSLRGLTNASEGRLAEVGAESLSESDGGGRLALAEGSGSDSGDDDVLSVTVE
jgi:hypothetical protein